MQCAGQARRTAVESHNVRAPLPFRFSTGLKRKHRYLVHTRNRSKVTSLPFSSCALPVNLPPFLALLSLSRCFSRPHSDGHVRHPPACDVSLGRYMRLH